MKIMGGKSPVEMRSNQVKPVKNVLEAAWYFFESNIDI